MDTRAKNTTTLLLTVSLTLSGDKDKPLDMYNYANILLICNTIPYLNGADCYIHCRRFITIIIINRQKKTIYTQIYKTIDTKNIF